MYSHGLYSYGQYIYGLYSYCLYSYGLHSYGLYAVGPFVLRLTGYLLFVMVPCASEVCLFTLVHVES